jgi:ribulose-phosphate 3-epimerase
MLEATKKPTILIAPSLLSADFMNLERDIRQIEDYADWLHVDVMDGHFVPNLTIGPPIVKALKRITAIPLDVHLMISNPADQLDWFIDAGADLITLHLESTSNIGNVARPGTSAAIDAVLQPDLVAALIAHIKGAGRLAGLAINPDTPAELVLPFISQIDLVLLMSVHPGFGGQSFINQTLEKIRIVADAAKQSAPNLLIEVDGGINQQTASEATAAGANMLVAGQAVFGAADPVAALVSIRKAAASVQGNESTTPNVSNLSDPAPDA